MIPPFLFQVSLSSHPGKGLPASIIADFIQKRDSKGATMKVSLLKAHAPSKSK